MKMEVTASMFYRLMEGYFTLPACEYICRLYEATDTLVSYTDAKYTFCEELATSSSAKAAEAADLIVARFEDEHTVLFLNPEFQ